MKGQSGQAVAHWKQFCTSILNKWKANRKDGDMNWQEEPFMEFLNAVDRLLEERYGVTSNDTGMEAVAGGQESGWSPEDTAAWLAEHYELTPINGGVIK
jgi:hypothetical protein